MRWILRVAGLLLLLAVAAVAGLLLVPADRIAGMVAARFQAATGRAMVISGGVHPTLWPELGIRAGKVQIANAAWSKTGPMLTAEGLVVGVDPVALISGQVKVERVELDAPQILLEKSKTGQANWDLSAPPAATSAGAAASQPAPGGGPTAFSIAKAVVNGGALRYVDAATGLTEELSGVDATLKMPQAEGPAELTMTARLNGQPVTLAASVGKPQAVLAGAATPLDLKFGAGGSTLALAGSADPKGAVKGRLDAALSDLPAVFKAAGLAAPALPPGLGAKRILVKGTLAADAAGQVVLDGADLTLDGNVLKGRVALALGGPRPKLSAVLSAGKLDLSALGGGKPPEQSAKAAPATGGGAAAPSGWSTAPIDAGPLRLADADVSLSAAGIDLGTMKLGQTDARLALKAGRAVVTLNQVVAYQGKISGQIAADAGAGKGLAVSADLTAANVALQPLLTDFADYRRLIGTGTLQTKLAASGGSMAALMNGLSGSGALSLGKGELQGFDLAGMITHLNPNFMGAGAKTIFDSVKASYTIQGGVLSNDDLTFASPILDATGKGTVGIGAQTLDYVVTPVALKGVAGANGVALPVKISGSWAAPRFGLDMNSPLGQKIVDERKKLGDKAKAEAEKALGLPPGSTGGGSLKDFAREGVMKLLGGGN